MNDKDKNNENIIKKALTDNRKLLLLYDVEHLICNVLNYHGHTVNFDVEVIGKVNNKNIAVASKEVDKVNSVLLAHIEYASFLSKGFDVNGGTRFILREVSSSIK